MENGAWGFDILFYSNKCLSENVKEKKLKNCLELELLINVHFFYKKFLLFVLITMP